MKEKRSIWSLLVERLIPIFTWVMVVMSLGLQIGAQKSMGVYRDLIVRNRLLTDSILTKSLMGVYQWGIWIGICLCLVIFYYHKRRLIPQNYLGTRKSNIAFRLVKYCRRTLIVSLIWFIMISVYDQVPMLAYPWMIFSVMVMVCIQYIRLFFVGLSVCKNSCIE